MQQRLRFVLMAERQPRNPAPLHIVHTLAIVLGVIYCAFYSFTYFSLQLNSLDVDLRNEGVITLLNYMISALKLNSSGLD
jgi:hypothetical protein